MYRARAHTQKRKYFDSVFAKVHEQLSFGSLMTQFN